MLQPKPTIKKQSASPLYKAQKPSKSKSKWKKHKLTVFVLLLGCSLAYGQWKLIQSAMANNNNKADDESEKEQSESPPNQYDPGLRFPGSKRKWKNITEPVDEKKTNKQKNYKERPRFKNKEQEVLNGETIRWGIDGLPPDPRMVDSQGNKISHFSAPGNADISHLSFSSDEDKEPLLPEELEASPKTDLSESFALLYDTPPALDEFPEWIQTYAQWHSKVRQEFPGMELFQNPNAPKLLVRVCLGLCGGLHDRLGQLPWDLYLANQTQRVLLISWQRPRELEHFLLPATSLLDWRIPGEAHFGFDFIRDVRNYTELFHGYPEDHPTESFWGQDLDSALQRATTGKFKDIKILRHRILGHLGEKDLEQRLGDSTIHKPPMFGKLFWFFFRPSREVDWNVREILESLELLPGKYMAVHCRVRHPKAFDYGINIKGKNPNYPADKTGLPWKGETKQAALKIAAVALKCALHVEPRLPVYFLSDSNDLVMHIQQDGIKKSSNNITTAVEHTLFDLAQHHDILTRDNTEENAHLDRQKGREPHAYYSTFVDLIVTTHAKCAVYGIGYYAAFAAKIGSAGCAYLYQEEAWGVQARKQAHVCPVVHNRSD